MLELLLIPALIGAAFAIDYIPSINDIFDRFSDAEDEYKESFAVQVELENGVSIFEGTDADEYVTGNSAGNTINGAGGVDELRGEGGNDTLIGGAGDDRLLGDQGADVANPGPDNDRVFLGDGNDSTAFDTQEDLDNMAGNDLIRGGANADLLVDSKGNNDLFGDTGRDTLVAIDGLEPGGESVQPGEEGTPDNLDGGYGADTIVGDEGDVLTGGFGNDNFVVARAGNTAGAPTILTDFDAQNEMLSVIFLEDAPNDTTVEFVHDPEAQELQAVVDGTVVALLRGLDAEDIGDIQTYVANLPELLEGVA